MENDNSTNEIRVFAMSTNIRLDRAAVGHTAKRLNIVLSKKWSKIVGQLFLAKKCGKFRTQCVLDDLIVRDQHFSSDELLFFLVKHCQTITETLRPVKTSLTSAKVLVQPVGPWWNVSTGRPLPTSSTSTIVGYNFVVPIRGTQRFCFGEGLNRLRHSHLSQCSEN